MMSAVIYNFALIVTLCFFDFLEGEPTSVLTNIVFLNVYFCSFLVTISIHIEKSIDGVLGPQTRGHRMVGADKTTELWRPPNQYSF